MKLSINWLKEYISLSETPQEIAKLLTQSGLEVVHIQSFEPIPGNLAGMLIGQIVSCTKHPNADKLSLTQVNIGAGQPLSIVCGAPNVAIGQKVVVAPVGTTLHTYTGEQILIKAAKIRGEVSEGMLCAADEIGLGPGHEGILVLNTSLAPGTPANAYFNLQPDTILTIDLTPNRIEACSHLGVARELRALLDRPIKYPSLLPQPLLPQPLLPQPLLSQLTPTTTLLPIQVSMDDADACPRYSGITIAGVHVQESPRWLQDKLKSIGLHPINNMVDITNLVMCELGQPLHVFDYDKLVGKEVRIRRSQKGEQIITLDSINRTLTGQELVIADKDNSIALAGILGGKSTSVGTATKNVFLESAYFSPSTIRTAAKHHKIQTDAAFRYERGTDPHLTVVALQRACLLIQEIAGGQIASALIDSYPRPIESLRIQVYYENIQKLIGQYIPTDTIRRILHHLDIEIINEDQVGFIAIVPPYRVDVTREVDIVEEILRIYGYDNIQPLDHLRSTFLSVTKPPSAYQLTQALGTLLVANGYQEICTNSLIGEHKQNQNQVQNHDQVHDQDQDQVQVQNQDQDQDQVQVQNHDQDQDQVQVQNHDQVHDQDQDQVQVQNHDQVHDQEDQDQIQVQNHDQTQDQKQDASELGTQNKEKIKLLNPLSDRLAMLRDTLVFSGLEVLAHNINRKQFDLKLFEFGKTYHYLNNQYVERNRLGIWLTGNIEPLNWIRKPRAVTFQDLNAILSKLLEKCGILHFNTIPLEDASYQAGTQLENASYQTGTQLENASYKTGTQLENASYKTGTQLENASYQTGTQLENASYQTDTQLENASYQTGTQLESARYQTGIQLVYQAKVFATIGQLGAQYVETVGVTQPVFFADIDIDQLNTYTVPTPYYQPIAKFPVVKRDLSLVVDSSISFEDIKNILTEKQEALIQDMHVFDVYQGANLPTGKKAYALSFALQDKEKTLDEKTIYQVMSNLIHTFESRLGAIIRE